MRDKFWQVWNFFFIIFKKNFNVGPVLNLKQVWYLVLVMAYTLQIP